MDVTHGVEELYAALCVAARGVTGRSFQPVQGMVRLEARDDGTLTFSATDLEYLSVSRTLYSYVDAPGEVMLPTKQAIAILKGVEKGELVRIRTEDGQDRVNIEITAGVVGYKLKGLRTADHQRLPGFTSIVEVRFDTAELIEIIQWMAISWATDQQFDVLRGALLEFDQDGITAVSLDNHRLSVVSIPLTLRGLMAPVSAVVSSTALTEWSRLLRAKGAPNEVWMRVGKVTPGDEPLSNPDMVSLIVGDTVAASRLVEGKFPNHSKVTTKVYAERVDVDRKALIAALTKMVVVAKEDSNRVLLRTNDTGTSLNIHAQSLRDDMSADVDIPADVHEGAVTQAYNVRFLLDVLGVIKTDKVELEFEEEGIYKNDGDETDEYKVKMLRVRGEFMGRHSYYVMPTDQRGLPRR